MAGGMLSGLWCIVAPLRCCRCGAPFFEYHHIRGYAVTGHVADEMMILCPTCHHLATVGALDESKQRRLKALPYNRVKGYSSGQLWTRREVLLIDIGSNVLAGPGYKLMVDDRVLFSVRHGENDDLLISLEAYDDQDNLSLLLVDNEWIIGSESVTDFIAKPLWVKLSSPFLARALIVDARDPFLIVRGSLRFRGRGWDIGNQMLSASGGYAFAGMGFFDCGFHFNSADQTFTIGSLDDPVSGIGAWYALAGAPSRAQWAKNVVAQYRNWKSSNQLSDV
jgi:hypothetical protein